MKNLFVVCIRNTGYEVSLELHKIYRVVPDKEAEANGDLRASDESGEDYLFPASYFATIDMPAERHQESTGTAPRA